MTSNLMMALSHRSLPPPSSLSCVVLYSLRHARQFSLTVQSVNYLVGNGNKLSVFNVYCFFVCLRFLMFARTRVLLKRDGTVMCLDRFATITTYLHTRARVRDSIYQLN